LYLPRSSAYYTPNTGESLENLALMRKIDEVYTKYPFYGSPRITLNLNEHGVCVNEKRVVRLMQVMGIQAALPGPHTSKPHPQHKIYPYLLREMEVCAPDEVWCADITYIPMHRGHMYLVAVMDWHSRYVISWELSNSLDTDFCLEALESALATSCPGIFNTDQGSQFTSGKFTGTLLSKDVRISMDGRGRCFDNIFIERLWRSVKYEDIYLRDYADGAALYQGLESYFHFYNHERPHSALGNKRPAQCYNTSGEGIAAHFGPAPLRPRPTGAPPTAETACVARSQNAPWA
jgi:putative transposase